MNLDNIGKDCPCYEFDGSEPIFDIGEFNALSPNDGKLTIEVNGVKVGDFSANQPEDETINIQVVTQTDIDNAVSAEAELRRTADQNLQGSITDEETARINADKGLQSQIDTIVSKSDVVDIVATYAALLAYDTSKLGDNDVLEVLSDETHDNAVSYYRWNKGGNTWVYIGSLSPSYTKAETDALLNQKQNVLIAGDHIDITGDTISVDTTDLVEKSELDDYYTKTETDTKLEPKLEVDVVETLTAQGEEGKIYLTPKAHTTQTATGNPITATVTDGAGQIEDFQLDGDTFQQSYSGKNLFNIDNYSSAILRGGGSAVSVAKENATTLKLTNLISQGSNFCGIPIPNSDNLLGKSVTISGTVELGTGASDARVAVYAGSSTSVGTSVASTNISASGSFTLAANIPASYPSGADRIHYVIYASGNTSPTVGSTVLYSNLQLEVGSVTDYEPYVGGIASPNPTYPQPIQVVTGTQTVAINGTNYPLDLGTIELCKLGTYQDYIWKDNGDWKVHKATKKITLNGSEEWLQDSNGGFTRFNIQIQETIFVEGRTLVGLSSHFVSSIVNAVGIFFLASTGIARRFYFYPETTITTVNGFKSWLESNNTTLLYPLDTATDTEITDATLISQLNAIASASLENGSNTITNTATGSNLAGDMEVDYFGYDPTNRYDKWLWLDINNAYEKLGS